MNELVIAGLGNPGKKYINTRHNIGFLVVDEIANKYNLSFSEKKLYSYASGRIEGYPVKLIKPNTFMNLSGKAVKSNFQNPEDIPEKLLVICDDIYLNFMGVRFKRKGSHGGHNGLRSIIDCCGTQEFQRMKVGISENVSGSDLSDYVLDPFSKKEKEMLPALLKYCCEAVECWVESGIDKTMKNFNGDVVT